MPGGASERAGRPPLLWILFGLLVLQALGGIGGGAALTAKPDGSLLGMPTSLLEGSPFVDYFFPGVILLLVLGIAPLAVSIGLLRHRPWAWFGALAVGCGLLVFELVEFAVVGYNVQQPIWAAIGCLIALACLAPFGAALLRTALGAPRLTALVRCSAGAASRRAVGSSSERHRDDRAQSLGVQ